MRNKKAKPESPETMTQAEYKKTFRPGKLELSPEQAERPVSPIGLFMLLKVAGAAYLLGLLSPPIASVLYKLVQMIGA